MILFIHVKCVGAGSSVVTNRSRTFKAFQEEAARAEERLQSEKQLPCKGEDPRSALITYVYKCQPWQCSLGEEGTGHLGCSVSLT